MLILATTVGLADIGTDGMFTDAVVLESIVMLSSFSTSFSLFVDDSRMVMRVCSQLLTSLKYMILISNTSHLIFQHN
jgi:hypothetical protein